MSRRPMLAALVLAAVVALPAPAPAQAASLGKLSLSVSEIRIYTLAGKLEVVPGTGTSVLVNFTLGGKDGSRISPKVWNAGATILAMKYPGDRVVYPPMGRWSSSSFQYG